MLLKNSLRRGCCHLRNLLFQLRLKLFFRIWQRNAQLFLNFTTVLKPDMLHDMGLCRLLNGLRLWVLTHNLSQFGVLQGGLMHSQMCFVILLNKRFNGLNIENIHILCHRICRFLIVFNNNDLIRILNTHHLQHLAVQFREIVNLRSHLGQLNSCLILNNPLRHRTSVWICYRNDVNHVVIRLFG